MLQQDKQVQAVVFESQLDAMPDARCRGLIRFVNVLQQTVRSQRPLFLCQPSCVLRVVG